MKKKQAPLLTFKTEKELLNYINSEAIKFRYNSHKNSYVCFGGSIWQWNNEFKCWTDYKTRRYPNRIELEIYEPEKGQFYKPNSLDE